MGLDDRHERSRAGEPPDAGHPRRRGRTG
jgi:hypothetical protein